MKNQNGFAPVIVLVLAALVVALSGGYYFLNKSKGNSLETTGKNPLSSFGKTILNDQCSLKDRELCKYINKIASNPKLFQEGLTMKTTTTTGKTVTEGIFEIASDKETRMVSTNNGKEVMQIITINNTTYIKDYADNKWWKNTTKTDDTKPNSNLIDTKKIEAEFKNQVKEMEINTTYKFIGKEKCGSLNCFKYQMNIKGMGETTTQYLLFDDVEYLMREMITEDKTGTKSIIEYLYGRVKISEPSPVKTENIPASGDSKEVQNFNVQGLDELKKKAFEELNNNSDEILVPPAEDPQE